MYFTNLSGVITVSTWFFKVFMLEGIYWFLLVQALWLEAGSRCQWYPETSKPACLVVWQVLVSKTFSWSSAWKHDIFFCGGHLSLGGGKHGAQRVSGNIKKQKRPCRSVGYVAVLVTSTSFRYLHSWKPHRAGCSGFLYSQWGETGNTKILWITSLRQDKACPRNACFSSAILVTIWVTQV